jgi:hypothetical protein
MGNCRARDKGVNKARKAKDGGVLSEGVNDESRRKRSEKKKEKEE